MAVDRDLPLYDIETMDALVERRIGGFAIIGNLRGIFALLSLALGAVGICGVTAYSAGQRTGEIGARLAMGASQGDVVRMVVSQGANRAALGPWASPSPGGCHVGNPGRRESDRPGDLLDRRVRARDGLLRRPLSAGATRRSDRPGAGPQRGVAVEIHSPNREHISSRASSSVRPDRLGT